MSRGLLQANGRSEVKHSTTPGTSTRMVARPCARGCTIEPRAVACIARRGQILYDYDHKGMVMKKISAAEFKARCLRIMDDVQATRETIVITKKGRPVARLVPVEAPSEDFLGRLTGLIQISGDIESPAEPVESWEVLR